MEQGGGRNANVAAPAGVTPSNERSSRCASAADASPGPRAQAALESAPRARVAGLQRCDAIIQSSVAGDMLWLARCQPAQSLSAAPAFAERRRRPRGLAPRNPERNGERSAAARVQCTLSVPQESAPVKQGKWQWKGASVHWEQAGDSGTPILLLPGEWAAGSCAGCHVRRLYDSEKP